MLTDTGYHRDQDTIERGTDGPFQRWEDDFTRLWNILIDAKMDGLTLRGDFDTIASMINQSRWMAAARSAGPVPHPINLRGVPLDSDTREKGHDGPFEDWEGDHTALVHVLWAASYDGLTLAENADQIAAMITRSRWLAAARAAGPFPR